MNECTRIEVRLKNTVTRREQVLVRTQSFKLVQRGSKIFSKSTVSKRSKIKANYLIKIQYKITLNIYSVVI
jgi:hypothetical protein